MSSAEYQIQVSIKSASGSFVVLDVSPNKTIQQVKQMVQEKDSTIETSNLIFEQKPLDDSKTLADYNITDNSDLYFATPTTDNKSEVSTNTRPQKKSRKRCSFKSCVSTPLRGVGDCGFCDGHFCSKHRLLEQHDCIGLHNCKQQLHERNASKLQSEQTVSNKV